MTGYQGEFVVIDKFYELNRLKSGITSAHEYLYQLRILLHFKLTW